MTEYDSMCVKIGDAVKHPGTYVAKLEYSYQSEIYGTFDECESWEVFDFDGNTITWFDDWYEGQDNCYCEDIISLEELLKAYQNIKIISGMRGWPEDNWQQVIELLNIE